MVTLFPAGHLRIFSEVTHTHASKQAIWLRNRNIYLLYKSHSILVCIFIFSERSRQLTSGSAIALSHPSFDLHDIWRVIDGIGFGTCWHKQELLFMCMYAFYMYVFVVTHGYLAVMLERGNNFAFKYRQFGWFIACYIVKNALIDWNIATNSKSRARLRRWYHHSGAMSRKIPDSAFRFSR